MAKNETIGTVECPVKACTEQCDVYRYRERGDSEKSVANRRFAGKLYARCTRHGRFDECGPDMQEYILENAKMHAPGAGDHQPAPAKTPATKPKSTPAAPAKRPATAPASSPARVANGGWGWPWE